MKKYSIYMLLALFGMTMSSCDEDFEDWAAPQTLEQEEAVTVPEFSVAQADIIKMDDFKEAETVKAFKLNVPELSEDMTIKNVTLSVKFDKEEAYAQTFPSNVEGQVNKADLLKLVTDKFGMRDEERKVFGHVTLDVAVGGSSFFTEAGDIEINVVPEKPSIEVYEELYLAGNHQGWKPEAKVIAKLYPTKELGQYQGYAYLDGEFKICTAPTWNEPQFGAGEDEGTIKLGGGNLKAEKGYYFITISNLDNTIKLEKREWGIVGDATPGGWDNSTPMIHDASDLKLKLTVELIADKEFKFRANNGRDVNLGGGEGKLTPGGGNIKVEETATYEVILDLTTPEYKYELIKK